MRPSNEIRFWQFLLAAELPFAKLERIRDHIASAPDESAAIDELKCGGELTEAEIRRAESAKASSPAVSGASIVPSDVLPERTRYSLPGLPGLWAIGDASIMHSPCVAIVGTRNATTYGKACAIKFAESISRAGATIVSGGAFGIDACAHRGALDARGKTIAVMPCGVDVPYPASHKNLFAEIRDKGGLQVSQFALGAPIRNDTFLTRNYLIAALSDAVLIVEAPEASGALHTANRAADMGKPVYAVPAAITQSTFAGSHSLIRSGATLIDHPDQILDDLKIVASVSNSAVESATEIQSQILNALSSVPISSESLAEKAGLDPSVALGELTMLELEGRVIRSFGGFVLAP